MPIKGSLWLDDRVIFHSVTVIMQQPENSRGAQDWSGMIQFPEGQMAVAGKTYRLKLADGRTCDILFQKDGNFTVLGAVQKTGTGV